MKKVNTKIYVTKNGKIIGYRLGHMDIYSIAVQYTELENCSFYECTFNEIIKEDKLLAAIKDAIKYFPLFKTSLAFDHEFYLKINDLDLSKVIKHSKVEDRPKKFGSIKTTNGYLFQVCYFKNKISFEWCHAISDGRGALSFFSKILDAYFDLPLGEIPNKFNLTLPYESIYDKKTRKYGQIKQEPGFKAKSFPLIKNGYKCKTTSIKIKTQDVLALAKRIDSTPVAVLAPLFCKAIKEHIPQHVKNRNVSCGIIVDGRKSIGVDTMHNCVFNKVITYTDKIDKLDIETQGIIYRTILDIYSQKDNLVAYATNMLDSVDFLYKLKPIWFKRIVMKAIAPIVKTTMNNCAFTYIGRVPFSNEVKERMSDFHFRSWPDIGGAVCAMADLNGTLILDITDNYVDSGVVDTFIDILSSYHIAAIKDTPFVFEQANMRHKDK